jgi:hypothetical protein
MNTLSTTKLVLIIVAVWAISACTTDRKILPESYNPVWTSHSRNASESMPCGGGDIGLNIWVEEGDILFYMARSGTFDENNTLVKLGRMRMTFTPNPFTGDEFKQELVLEDGYVKISGQAEDLEAELRIWVDVHRPVIHTEISCDREIEASVVYESWRHKDLLVRRNESLENSYKWMPPDGLVKQKDHIDFAQKGILFYHQNSSPTVFDITLEQQGLDSVKNSMYDPLGNLVYGGLVTGRSFKPAGTVTGRYLDTDFMGWKLESIKPARKHELKIVLHTAQGADTGIWHEGLQKAVDDARGHEKEAFRESRRWWNEFWQRSFILIGPETAVESPAWQVGRNYQLFRYMLGCNAYGSWPTKFNGGLFSYDPALINPDWHFTPDFRNWGGGTFTAQNQRLVYFPMLKSGDFDMMRPQFDFYLRSLGNAELRSRVYWGHEGACFTEQIENFGLPNCTEYGWNRPEGMDPGMQYNAWLEYQWDTSLEFCLMILLLEEYTGRDISEYIPLIESCLEFFDLHYRYLARERGEEELDSAGHLVLYPGSACETYKLALNPASTVAALKRVLNSLLALPENYLDEERRQRWTAMLGTIPPVPFRELEGRTLLSPAESWERVQNTEIPQLYPVFPWRLYGVGKPGLDTALNTWMYDPDVAAFRNHISWKQYSIMAACLGLSNEAAEETIKKLQDSGRRFPAFWGPGFDWVPDHNWGGSGMIGLQEMLLQADGEKIMLFPAWPGNWDVHFKLHAPRNTIVEARMKNGTAEILNVTPESRIADVIIMMGEAKN